MTSPLPFIAVSQECIITHVNPAFRTLSGLDARQLVKKSLFSIFTDLSVAQSGTEKLLNGLGLENHEFSLISKNGKELTALVSSTVYRKADNTFLSGLFISEISGSKKNQIYLRYLYEVARELTHQQNTSEALGAISKLIVPRFCNWFAISLKKGYNIELMHLFHQDPEKIKWAQAYIDAYPPDLNAPYGTGYVIRSGMPSYIPQVTEEMIQNETERLKSEAVRQIGLQSVIIAPMSGKNNIIGSITFICSETGRHFDEIDFHFAQSLAGHIGLLLENIRLNELASAEISGRRKAENQLNVTRNQLGSVMASGLIGTWVRDIDNNVLYADETLSKMFGVPYDVNGSEPGIFLSKVAPNDRLRITDVLQEAIKNHQVYETEYELSIDDSSRWLLSRGRVSLDDHGQPKWFTGVALDITERKAAELALIRAEELFRVLAETIPQKVFMTDAENHLTYMSPQWEDFTGLKVNEISDEVMTDLIHPDDRDDNLAKWWDAVAKGEHFIYEHRFRNHAGDYVWHLTRALPLKNDNGEIVGWIGTMTDIHDRKVAEKLKDDFISIASHELRTPLTTLKIFFQLIAREMRGDSKLNSLTEKAVRQSNRLERLINDLLDVTRISSGKITYHCEDFDFAALLKETVANIQETAGSHQIVVNGNDQPVVHGDHYRMEQVLVNLLNNAVKYSPGADQIIVSYVIRDNTLRVSIQDFGIGIAEKNLPHLFSRFYRADVADKRFEGLGLGLYIAADIIRRHGGEISVESQPDQGSVFRFWLPLAAGMANE